MASAPQQQNNVARLTKVSQVSRRLANLSVILFLAFNSNAVLGGERVKIFEVNQISTCGKGFEAEYAADQDLYRKIREHYISAWLRWYREVPQKTDEELAKMEKNEYRKWVDWLQYKLNTVEGFMRSDLQSSDPALFRIYSNQPDSIDVVGTSNALEMLKKKIGSLDSEYGIAEDAAQLVLLISSDSVLQDAIDKTSAWQNRGSSDVARLKLETQSALSTAKELAENAIASIRSLKCAGFNEENNAPDVVDAVNNKVDSAIALQRVNAARGNKMN